MRVLARPGLGRHASYVALSRHRDGVDLHYGRDDFADREALASRLGRDRAKDMASDYAPAPAPEQNAAPDFAQPDQRDPAKDFAERRGITFREKVVEIVRKIVPEKLRSPFDGLKLSVPKIDPTPTPDKPLPAAEPQKPLGCFDGLNLQVAPTRAERPPLDRAVEHYARAIHDSQRVMREGLDVLPHQREALKQAREALDAIRPDGTRDLRAALVKDNDRSGWPAR